MKNIIANGAVLMIAPMFLFSCSVQSKQSKDSETNAENAVSVQEQQKDSMLSTLELDGMKVTWIRDNANDRLMPRSLFPDATDAQIDSLSLQNGVPALISTFLVETDGKRILFDAGMGAPDSKLFEGLKSLNISPADIDYLFITH